jgi:hypothetical protein
MPTLHTAPLREMMFAARSDRGLVHCDLLFLAHRHLCTISFVLPTNNTVHARTYTCRESSKCKNIILPEQ